MAAEQTYLQLLAQVEKFAIDGDELMLSGESGNNALIYARETGLSRRLTTGGLPEAVITPRCRHEVDRPSGAALR